MSVAPDPRLSSQLPHPRSRRRAWSPARSVAALVLSIGFPWVASAGPITQTAAGVGAETAELAAPELGVTRQVDLLAARVSFLVPEALTDLRPRPPALFEGALIEHSVETQRLIVFVIPASPEASADEILRAAELVASTLIGFTLPVKASDDATRPLVARGEASFWKATLAVGQDRDRHIGFLTFGAADEDGLDGAPLVAAGSLGRPELAYPTAPTTPQFDRQHGFSIETPAGFEREDPEWPVLFWAHPPQSHGISAEISIRLAEYDLGQPLATAAELLFQRMADGGEDGGASDALHVGPPAPVHSAGLPGFALPINIDGDRGYIALIDLPRHRAEITLWVEGPHFEAFDAAFEHTLASLQPAAGAPQAALEEDAYQDSEAGFTFRAPQGFTRVPAPDALVTFIELAARPPRSELHVRRLDGVRPPSSMAEAQDAADRRALEEAARGYEDNGRRSLKIEKGRPAVGFQLTYADSQTGAPMIDSRTLIAGYGATFEFSFVGAADQRERDQSAEEASRITFRTAPPMSAPALAAEIAWNDARLRPPRDWAANQDGARFNESEYPDAAAIVVGALHPIDAGPLAGPGEVVRTTVAAELAATGATVIRARGAERDPGSMPPATTLSFAYNLDGVPFRELRRVLELEDRLIYARAFVPADRYAGMAELLSATTDSLAVASSTNPEEKGAAADGAKDP